MADLSKSGPKMSQIKYERVYTNNLDIWVPPACKCIKMACSRDQEYPFLTHRMELKYHISVIPNQNGPKTKQKSYMNVSLLIIMVPSTGLITLRKHMLPECLNSHIWF